MTIELRHITVDNMVYPEISFEEAISNMQLSDSRLQQYSKTLLGLNSAIETIQQNPRPSSDSIPFILLSLETLFAYTDVNPVKELIPALESYDGQTISVEAMREMCNNITVAMEAESKEKAKHAEQVVNSLGKKARKISNRTSDARAALASVSETPGSVLLPDSFAIFGPDLDKCTKVSDLKAALKRDIAVNENIIAAARILTDTLIEGSAIIKKETINLKFGYGKLVSLLNDAVAKGYSKLPSVLKDRTRLLGSSEVDTDVDRILNEARQLDEQQSLLKLASADIQIITAKPKATRLGEISGITKKDLIEILDLVDQYTQGVDVLGEMMAGKVWMKIRNSINYWSLAVLVNFGNPIAVIWFAGVYLLSHNFKGYMNIANAFSAYSGEFIAPAMRRQQKVSSALLDLVERATRRGA